MNHLSIFKVAGILALLTAAAEIAGAAIGAANGLGGQNLPLGSEAELLALARNREAYLWREWLYLLVAIFALGEGLGLYYLVRRTGGIAVWALGAWSVGLIIGIVEDAMVVALVDQFSIDYAAADESSRGALAVSAKTYDAIIRLQQFVANALGSGVGLGLFAIAGLRTARLPRWLAVVGLVAAVGVGWVFGIVNVFDRSAETVAMYENAFALLVVWDIGIGVTLLRYRDPDEATN